MAAATAVPSMTAPSTMLSGGTGSLPKAETRNPLPAGLSSTALTALEPMSSPAIAPDFPKPNTVAAFPQSEYQALNRPLIARPAPSREEFAGPERTLPGEGVSFFSRDYKMDLRCAAKTDAKATQSNPRRRSTTNSTAKKEFVQEFDAISSVALERESGLSSGWRD